MGPILMEQHLHSQEGRASSAQPASRPSYRPRKPLRAAPQRADPNPGRICLVSQFCVHRGSVQQNQHILTTSLHFTYTGVGHKVQISGDTRGPRLLSWSQLQGSSCRLRKGDACGDVIVYVNMNLPREAQTHISIFIMLSS